jgi:hypothetical protein
VKALLGIALSVTMAVGAAAPASALEAGSGSVGVPVTYFEFCVARVCIGLPEESAVSSYGPGHPDPPERPTRRCYQLNAGSTYLTVSVDANEPSRPITGVLLTSEPVCAAAEPATVDESSLVTCEEIRLGDPSEKVEALGAKQAVIGGKGNLWRNKSREVAQFDYPCTTKVKYSAMASAYVRSGHVVGIAVWSQGS